MSNFVSDTQPTRPVRPSEPQPTKSKPNKPPRKPGRLWGWLRSPVFMIAASVLAALLLVGGASAAAGWSSGRGQLHATATIQAGLYMLDQYNLAMEDMEAGRYDLARERLEYIYYQNPDFLDVIDKLVQVMFVLSTTTEPTSTGPQQPSATPTQDPRPKEELFAAAQALFTASDWSGTIDTLLALRKADPAFRTADVDGMLFASLRNRGAQNITQLGLFEPGLYDFALAEKFGPLDGQANNYREWARLYLYGNAFWLAYPEEAAYYYGQLVGLAPDLPDSQGLSAFYRYWQSLVHWGDKLAAEGSWCDALERYQQAQSARNDGDLQPTADNALIQCLGPSETPSFTPPFTATWTATGTLLPSNTPMPTFTTGPTNTTGPSETPTNTLTPTSTPTPTETPTETPTFTDTPATP